MQAIIGRSYSVGALFTTLTRCLLACGIHSLQATETIRRQLNEIPSGAKIVKPFVKSHRIKYPIVLGDDELASRFRVASMPTTLLIDRKGKIVRSHMGVVDRIEFEKLRELLEIQSRFKHKISSSRTAIS